MSVLPAAEAAAGDTGEMADDIDHMSAHLDDVTESGKGATADLLRPFYLDYLRASRGQGTVLIKLDTHLTQTEDAP